ncbi:MAG: thrombospondin type 3 repeat-containing protein, partial [Chloroflexota bacterium]
PEAPACQTLPTIEAFNVSTAPMFPDGTPGVDADADGIPNRFDLCPMLAVPCSYAVDIQYEDAVRIDLSAADEFPLDFNADILFRLVNERLSPDETQDPFRRELTELSVEIAFSNPDIFLSLPLRDSLVLDGYQAYGTVFDYEDILDDAYDIPPLIGDRAGSTEIVVTLYSLTLERPVLAQDRFTLSLIEPELVCITSANANLPVRFHPAGSAGFSLVEVGTQDLQVYARSGDWLLFRSGDAYGWIEEIETNRSGLPFLPPEVPACQTLPTIEAFNVSTAPVFPDGTPGVDTDADGIPNRFDLCPFSATPCRYVVDIQYEDAVRLDLIAAEEFTLDFNADILFGFVNEGLVPEDTQGQLQRELTELSVEIAFSNPDIFSSLPLRDSLLLDGYQAYGTVFDYADILIDAYDLPRLMGEGAGSTEIVVTLYSLGLERPILAQDRFTLSLIEPEDATLVEITVTPSNDMVQPTATIVPTSEPSPTAITSVTATAIPDDSESSTLIPTDLVSTTTPDVTPTTERFDVSPTVDATSTTISELSATATDVPSRDIQVPTATAQVPRLLPTATPLSRVVLTPTAALRFVPTTGFTPRLQPSATSAARVAPQDTDYRLVIDPRQGVSFSEAVSSPEGDATDVIGLG